MKQILLTLSVFLISISTVFGQSASDFVTEWELSGPPGSMGNISFYLLGSGPVAYTWSTVDAGAQLSGLGSSSSGSVNYLPNQISLPAGRRVELRMEHVNISGFRASSNIFSYNDNIVSLKSWGAVQWTTLNGSFAGCRLMELDALLNNPDLQLATDMNYAFFRCQAIISGVSGWNVSAITTMASSFSQCSSFIDDLSGWDVSNVTVFSNLFSQATSFNSDLSNWDVSSGLDFELMFMLCSNFQSDLSSWDMSNAVFLKNMFAYASAFNADISQWDTPDLLECSGMFAYATSFNSDLSNLDVSQVSDFTQMFEGASLFDGDISSWDMSSAVRMPKMFKDAISFNHSIDAWDVSSVVDVSDLFFNARAFNQPLNSWDVSSLRQHTQMFYGASSFNQDLDNWDVSSWTYLLGTFRLASAFNGDVSTWDVSNVTFAKDVFNFATSFNSNISLWDVSSVTTMEGLFERAYAFNQDISSWDVSSVTNMDDMFDTALSFDQNLSSWDISSISNLRDMFRNSGLSCENYSSFLVGQANNSSLPSGISFRPNSLLYGNDAIAARNTLVNTKGWTITGDSPSGFNCLSVPLPVELLNFSVQSLPQGHQATWSTASELNNSHFILEHALGDDDFQELGHVKGKGTTSKTNTYEYMHATAEPGVHYYRLRQVDFDGASALSDVVAVNREGGSALSVYPNPADQTLTLQGVAEGEQFVLTDALGRVVLAGKYNGNELAVDQLPAGTYVVQVEKSDVAQRFVKL